MSRFARRSRWVLLGCIVLLSFTGGGLPLALGEAATTRVVTSLTDPGNGGCTPAECTLREAIAVAQAGDTITFKPALFTNGPRTLRLNIGPLLINQDLTLVGPGQALLAISGKHVSGVIRIEAGTVIIKKVTITEGLSLQGSGIYNAGTLTLSQSTVRDNFGFVGKGSIYNAGTLRLLQSLVSQNLAGIYNDLPGRLTLRQSTVSRHIRGLSNIGIATLIESTVMKNEGGIVNDLPGRLTLRQSTVSENIGGLSNTGIATLAQSTVSGNAIYGINNSNNGTLTLRQSTVSKNIHGGLFSTAKLTLHTTLIAGNTDGTIPFIFDCKVSGTFQNQGHNLTGAGTGCPNDPGLGDLIVDPALIFTQVLKPLRNNGGSTKTHALWPRSLAIDAGDPAKCSGTDQRGVPRPQGAGCDIGAFEREVP